VPKDGVNQRNRARWAGKVPLPAWIIGAVICLATGIYLYSWATFPSDRTPHGAYLRIVRAVNQGQAENFFAYTEEAAQHACFTIGGYREEALAIAGADFPPDRLRALEADYGAVAKAEPGPGVFALMVEREGWLVQLRADVSGIARVEQEGPRATIETVKGTRYSMRERPNGIWGLTAFTPALVEEAEHAARDLELIKKAAEDFKRAQPASSAAP
jgi:hypothetical protein